MDGEKTCVAKVTDAVGAEVGSVDSTAASILAGHVRAEVVGRTVVW